MMDKFMGTKRYLTNTVLENCITDASKRTEQKTSKMFDFQECEKKFVIVVN